MTARASGAPPESRPGTRPEERREERPAARPAAISAAIAAAIATLIGATITAAIMAAIATPAIAGEAPRPQMHYRGFLGAADGTPLADSIWSVTFRLWDRSVGGSALWAESLQVRTTNGEYSALLGLRSPLPARTRCWLSVHPAGSLEALTRVEIDPEAYCINADMVDGLHVSSNLPWIGSGYSEGLGTKLWFRIVGDRGPEDLYIPFGHWTPFHLVVTCPHAAPGAGDIAAVDCIENDGVIACLGSDGSGDQVRSSANLGSTDRILSVRGGRVTVSCPGDSTLRLRIHTQGEWVLGHIIY